MENKHSIEVSRERHISSNIFLIVFLCVMMGIYIGGMYLNAHYHKQILDIDKEELKKAFKPTIRLQINEDDLKEEDKEDRQDIIEISPVTPPLNV